MLHHTGTARYVTFQVHHSFQYTRQYTGAEYFEVRAIKAVSMQVFKCWKMGHFHKKDPPPAESYAKSEAEEFHHIFFSSCCLTRRPWAFCSPWAFGAAQNSQGYELGQPSRCQSGWLAMPRSILRILTWFVDTVFVVYQPFWCHRFVFVPRIYKVRPMNMISNNP